MSVHSTIAAVEHDEGGYRYLPSLRFASGAVASLPGIAIERATLTAPLRLADGFALVRRHLEAVGRTAAALCGIELRSPAQISMDAFKRFNDEYLGEVDALGLLRDGAPPLTRTNVAPFAKAPATPSLVAFSYTVAEERPAPSFVVSGVAEVATGKRYPQDVVRPGETSPDALAEKARSIVEDIDTLLAPLGVAWDDATSVHLYSQHALAHELVRDVLPAFGRVPLQGIVWHDAAPPVDGLALEIDVRGYAREHVLRVA
jgi:hypothetical protein